MRTILQKYIAQSGYCSRRQAEKLIRDGLVMVNGKTAEPGMSVGGEDEVRVGKQKIGAALEKIYIALNKPRGYTCTSRSFAGERNVFDLIDDATSPAKPCLATPSWRGILHIVGRLDKNSRGLVLLTNDGELSMRLTHPRFQHEKEYLVKVAPFNEDGKSDKQARISDRALEKISKAMKTGFDIGEGDGLVKVEKIAYIDEGKFKLILAEGKKRQIRRMFEILGFAVLDLERIRIGRLKLGDLPEGQWRELDPGEVAVLK